MPDPSFVMALRSVEGVGGWMTDAQALRLWDAAAALKAPARVVEIGSFQGRSTIVLAKAAPPGVEVVAIDPHAGNDRGPQEFEGFADAARGDHETFLRNLDVAGVGGRVRHVRQFSHDALASVDGPVDVLYIDGAHRYGPALADIRQWGPRVTAEGTMLIHDAFSSVGVTMAILAGLLLHPSFRYQGRDGSLAVYRRADTPRAANAWRQLAQLPWFVRNIVIKALLLARLAPLTRLLGHRTGGWPY